jgi:hypothetical protein
MFAAYNPGGGAGCSGGLRPVNKYLTLPDFIMVSPGKTATNTLFECLREHPSICMAQHVKGTRFFDKLYDNGIEWYARLFEHCPEHSVKGEVDETYFYAETVPARIHRHIPNVKIIICLRNPTERAFSAYLQFLKFGLMSGTFEEAIEKYPDIFISNNFYYDHLVRYLDYFSRENVLVMLFDDFKKDRRSFIKDLYAFLDVDDSFVPKSLDIIMNPARRPRFKIINKMAFHAARFFRKLDMLLLFEVANRSKFVKKILFNKQYGNDYPEMSSATRKRLQNIFQNQIDNLGSLIERNLQDWK